ncbi:unnamed protein product [Brachionus calyciflorus]|uniref:Ubiquitin-like protease family profile domain-containing protein n=1 Tax=Brachionus calyciflorus TaxID=104777 RepID=A0A813U7M0_9BILA|nr:unnamed protein product [Brachionus calyciflorus]
MQLIEKNFQNFEEITKYGISLKQDDIIRLKPRVSTQGVNSVLHWDKKENIFIYDMAMIPININNNHWILCSIDNRLCKVSIYDSFVKEYPDLIKNLREFLSLKYSTEYH